MAARTRSLVLAAHGSLAAENSNQPLHGLAKTVAELAKTNESANFEVVTPAFLNGHPEMTGVLESLPPGDVAIVPVMTSVGYYLKKLPGKFAQNGNVDDFQLFLTPVIGIHDTIPILIGSRITETLDRFELPLDETTVVVIGHGTRRNATSGQSTMALTDELRCLQPGLIFETAFLDQDPTAEWIASQIDTRHTLVVPFLISRGPHTTEDVPGAFGLPTGPDIEFPIVKHSGGRTCICDLPVGMYPEVADICLELAIDAVRNKTPIVIPPIKRTVGELTS